MKRNWILSLLCTAALQAQTAEQTVGASTSLTYAVPADEAAFDVEISAPQFVEAAQVVRVLADLGAKEENIARVSTTSGVPQFAPVLLPSPAPPPFAITWLLQFSVPAARFRETSDRLDGISRRLPGPFTGITYSGGLSYSRAALDAATAAALARQVEQARLTLQPLAQAAGIAASPVASLLETTRGATDFALAFSLGGRVRVPSLSATTISSVRFGRLPERTLITSCSHEAPLAADEALFRVQVQAAVTTPRARVVEALSPFGIADRDLVDQSWTLPIVSVFVPGGSSTGTFSPLPQYTYTFELRQPMSRAQEAATSLARLRNAPPEMFASVIYGVGLNASDRAQQQASAKGAADTIAVCRSRAERIAAALQLKLGAVRNVLPVPFGQLVFGFPSQPLAVESNLRAQFAANVTFALE